MKPIQIAVCGAPQVGKSTLLERMSSLCGWRETVRTLWKDAVQIELHARVKGVDHLFRTLPGPILYFEKRITELLKDADLIIYVIQPNLMEGDDVIQSDFLDKHLKIAKSLGRDWDAGKWLLVMNKADRAKESSMLEKFPQVLRKHVIFTQAINGQGLESLLKKIEGMV
ncbi:MAG TPA: GTPase domain-containing protein [Verrucomicrobiae bacterium]